MLRSFGPSRREQPHAACLIPARNAVHMGLDDYQPT